MTSTQLSLLRRICEEPANDHLRQVFADATEDAGDEEHAEFIRAQCELHRLESSSDSLQAIPDLRRRERELMRNAGLPGWWDWLPGKYRSTDGPRITTADGITYDITRGFISTITLSWQTWLDIHARIYWPRPKCERCGGKGSILVDENEPREKCPSCSGRGVIEPSDECERCRGRGHHGNGTYSHCFSCGGLQGKPGTGCVPRQFPGETAQPLERVNLSTWPEFYAGLIRLRLDERDGPAADAFRRHAAAEWPGLEFSLPGEERGGRTTQELRRELAERMAGRGI